MVALPFARFRVYKYVDHGAVGALELHLLLEALPNFAVFLCLRAGGERLEPHVEAGNGQHGFGPQESGQEMPHAEAKRVAVVPVQ